MYTVPARDDRARGRVPTHSYQRAHAVAGQIRDCIIEHRVLVQIDRDEGLCSVLSQGNVRRCGKSAAAIPKHHRDIVPPGSVGAHDVEMLVSVHI